MAIGTDSLIEIGMKMSVMGQVARNVFQYRVSAYVGGVSAANIAEAYWGDVKTTYRNLVQSIHDASFVSVTVRELNNPTGDLAEYAVPTGESKGTRTSGGSASLLPSYCACGVRFTVGSRVTRAGQKRLPFLCEDDTALNQVGSEYIALATTWATNITSQIILGAPALGVTLIPIVTRKNPATGAVLASQDVTGFVINPRITTQNTRKAGRGE